MFLSPFFACERYKYMLSKRSHGGKLGRVNFHEDFRDRYRGRAGYPFHTSVTVPEIFTNVNWFISSDFDEKGIGAEMCPAIVSEIFIGHAPVSY